MDFKLTLKAPVPSAAWVTVKLRVWLERNAIVKITRGPARGPDSPNENSLPAASASSAALSAAQKQGLGLVAQRIISAIKIRASRKLGQRQDYQAGGNSGPANVEAWTSHSGYTLSPSSATSLRASAPDTLSPYALQWIAVRS